MPRVTAVVVTHNSSGSVEGCLRSLKRQGVEVEVVVVDNASTDDTVERVVNTCRDLGLPHRIIRNARNLGYTRAVNQGVRASGCGLVLVLNPDSRLADGWLPTALRAMTEDPRVCAVGSAVEDPETGIRVYGLRFDIFGGYTFALRRGEEHFPSGAAVLFRRRALAEVGYFDELLFLYYDELDLFLKFGSRGYRHVTIDVPCFHELRTLRRNAVFSDPNLPLRLYSAFRGRLYLLLKYAPWGLLPLSLTVALLLMAGASTYLALRTLRGDPLLALARAAVWVVLRLRDILKARRYARGCRALFSKLERRPLEAAFALTRTRYAARMGISHLNMARALPTSSQTGPGA